MCVQMENHGQPVRRSPSAGREHRLRGERTARLVAIDEIAEHDRRRRAPARPASRNCVTIRSRRKGRSPTSSRNSTCPFGRIERVRRAERRHRAAPAFRRISGPAASPLLNVSSATRPARRAARRSSVRRRTSRDRRRRCRGSAGDRASVRGTTRCRSVPSDT